mmetsp:Transcript_12215/g.36837  ORF Transcript_12215/g.36837 Transcript_12215/m.36837 type:complete len:400 (-) Transcript_12215:938-2137(-)
MSREESTSYTETPGAFGFVKVGASGAASEYPESGKKPMAVLFPGGGARAFSCGVGVLRALQAEALLEKAGFFSCVSGGGWCAVPFLYSPRSDDELLGEYSPPSQCSLKGSGKMCEFPSAVAKLTYASRVRGAMLSLFAWMGVDEFYLDLANRVFAASSAGDVDGSIAWRDVVAARYLTPAKIDTKALLGNSQSDATGNAVAPRRSALPTVLINATVQGPSDRGAQKTTKETAFPPLVITPEAAGSYVVPRDVTYDFRDSGDLTERLGGLVAPAAAFGGDEKEPFGLADAVGATSIAYATAINQFGDYGLLNLVSRLDKRQRLSLVKDIPVWSPTGTLTARAYDIGDGGNNGDNAGVVAALQRGVKSIFVTSPPAFTSTSAPRTGPTPTSRSTSPPTSAT